MLLSWIQLVVVDMNSPILRNMVLAFTVVMETKPPTDALDYLKAVLCQNNLLHVGVIG